MRRGRGEGDALISRSGGLAQLARAPALQAGGHRFDSDILHKERAEPVQNHRPRSGSLAIRSREGKQFFKFFF